MKVIFLGTPEFAILPLKALIENHDVVAVVTQPDAPGKRGDKLQYSPVKKYAIENGIDVLQFDKIRREGEILKNYQADVMITCAYGQILSKENLETTPIGTLNIHGSVLPKYRGAAPIQWAIINGEKETGVTILKSGVGMDDGDIMHIETLPILENDSAETLYPKLSKLGSECILKVLKDIENGNETYTPQNHDLATKCTMIKKEDCKINFNQSATSICNFVKGVNIDPVAYCTIDNVYFKVYFAKVLSINDIENFELNGDYEIGEVVMADSKKGLIIKALDGFVSITDIQPQNGKRMDIKSYLNGKKINIGSRIL